MNQPRPQNPLQDLIEKARYRWVVFKHQNRIADVAASVRNSIQSGIDKIKRLPIGATVTGFFRDIYYRFMFLEKRIRVLMGAVAAILVGAVLVTTSNGAPWTARTWEGSWTNRAYNSGGTLTCKAREVEPGKWEGTWSGVWKEEPYSYDVVWEAKPGRNESLTLSGTAKIDGHNYKWSGMMRGDTIRGKYNSNVGYAGEFVLNEQ